MKKKKLGRVAQLKHKDKKYKFKVDENSFGLLDFSKEQRDRYSPYKISWFPEKLKALQENRVTPPISSLINPTNKCNQDCFFCVYAVNYSGMHDGMELKNELYI